MNKGFIRLGDVCEVQNGYAFDSKFFSANASEGIPLIRIRDILNGFSKTYYTSDYQQEYIVHKGDYLIGMDGDFNIGQWRSEDALLNQRVCRLLPSEKVLPRFIYYYIPAALQEINSKTAYTTVKHLSSKQVKDILIPNISLAEQKRIVDFLDSGFAKVDRLQSNAEKGLQDARQLFHSVLKEELKPKNGWLTKHLNEWSSYSIGLTYKPQDVSETGTIVLRSSNIQNDAIALDDIVRVSCAVKDDLYVREGDILMCSRNGSAKLVGKVARIEKEQEQMTYGTFMTLIRSVYNPILFYFFRSNEFRKQISKGEHTMINQITKYMLNDVVVSLPGDPGEIERIASRLGFLDERCQTLQENYSRTIALCNDLKQGLTKKAFNGEL